MKKKTKCILASVNTENLPKENEMTQNTTDKQNPQIQTRKKKQMKLTVKKKTKCNFASVNTNKDEKPKTKKKIRLQISCSF